MVRYNDKTTFGNLRGWSKLCMIKHCEETGRKHVLKDCKKLSGALPEQV